MNETILTVTDLCVSYKKTAAPFLAKRKSTQVLDHVSFSMNEGEILGLVGESGCGKSTLAKTLLKLNPFDSGEIIHYSKYPQMVFQDPYGSLNPAKKVGWILEEPLRMHGGCDPAERKKKVAFMMKRVGLDASLADRYPRQLSGGQRQRVCIAAALMLKPGLLIADEPVSALDVTIQAQILDLLLQLQKEMGLAILFISHDLRVVYQLCSRVMIMQKGQIVESADAEQIYFAPQHAYTKSLIEAAGIMEKEEPDRK
jgi:ABC-type glutathione transport system ATPase component